MSKIFEIAGAIIISAKKINRGFQGFWIHIIFSRVLFLGDYRLPNTHNPSHNNVPTRSTAYACEVHFWHTLRFIATTNNLPLSNMRAKIKRTLHTETLSKSHRQSSISRVRGLNSHFPSPVKKRSCRPHPLRHNFRGQSTFKIGSLLDWTVLPTPQSAYSFVMFSLVWLHTLVSSWRVNLL